ASDEAIAASRQRLDQPWRVSRIAERVAEAVDDRVQAMIKIAERAVWPEAPTELVARDEVARAFQKQREDLDALFLQADPGARLPQLARPAIQFKDAKSARARRPRLFRHGVVLWPERCEADADPSTHRRTD